MLQLPFTLIDKDTFITLNYTTDAKQIKNILINKNMSSFSSISKPWC